MPPPSDDYRTWSRAIVFFVIALQSRRVTIAGIHPRPYGTWMEQRARNVTARVVYSVDGSGRRSDGDARR